MKYLTTTETNLMLHKIREDNETYGLIVKLMYLLGKNFNQIILLKKEDITENTIKFKQDTFPLKKEDYDDLMKLSNEEYIFLEEKQISENGLENVVDKYRKDLIYYFNHNLKQLDLPPRIKYGGFSLTDLRRLRGQHLILEGVDLKLVMKLYQQKPSARTQFKKYLQYDDLYKISSFKNYQSVKDIFDYCTDTEIFQMDDNIGDANQYIVTDMEESTLLLLDYDTITFIEDVSDDFKKDVVNVYQNTNLIDDVKRLQPNQYKILEGMKFIKV